MLFIDTTAVEVVMIVITSFLGMLSVAGGLEGYILREMNALERLLCIAGGLAMLYPGTLTDVIGIAIVAVVAGKQFLQNKKAPKAA